LINHLLWPPGSSVNNGIPDAEASISYDAFDCAVKDLVSVGSGSLMVKLDLKDAFCHIPICPADWYHLKFHWGGKFYYSIVLAFGLCSAPYIFNLFSEVLHWIIQHHIPAHICHYLDDFFLLFTPSFKLHMCLAAVE
jgi:Reverse transcriptase (RNA-dependent DNA polymerase)